MPEQGNQDDQREDAAMKSDGNDLRPAKVFVFRPNVLHLHRLAGKVRRRELRGEECLFDPRAKATEIGAPGDRQAAVYRPFRNRARAKEIFEIVKNARAKRSLGKGRVGATPHRDRAFRQELLEIRPKIIGNEQSRSAKLGNR